jgi:hypothetical protein
MNAVRIGFLRAREAERDPLPGEPARYLAVGRAPDAGATNMKVAIGRRVAVGSALEPGSYSVNALTEMESALGQLQSNDEDLLREPLLGMRLAEAAFRTRADPWPARRLSRWVEIFTARLNRIAIPAGTRGRLARALAVYEHEQAGLHDARHEVRQDQDTRRFATIEH